MNGERSILVVDDDNMVRHFLLKGLTGAGYHVETAGSCAEAAILATTTTFDLGIIDLRLPDGSGLSIMKLLREKTSDIPVIFLSAVRTVEEKTTILDSGADDYITKPFDLSELTARMNAVLRRVQNPGKKSAPSELTEYTSGKLHLDPNFFRATYDGKDLALTVTEFSALACLVAREGHAISRAELLEQVWKYSFDPGTNVVDVTISRLRKKLRNHNKNTLIYTVRSRGYLFKGDTA